MLITTRRAVRLVLAGLLALGGAANAPALAQDRAGALQDVRDDEGWFGDYDDPGYEDDEGLFAGVPIPV